MASTWISYNELAWTEDLLADPADYEDEVGFYVDLIKQTAENPPRTMLHLGSGAGGQDHIFKRHFIVTGVDLSAGMLNKARDAHPEIEYIEGDMRTIRLNRQFDVVAGLFPHATWDKIFKDAGFTMQEKSLNGIYDNYLLGDGEYPMTIFVGRKV